MNKWIKELHNIVQTGFRKGKTMQMRVFADEIQIVTPKKTYHIPKGDNGKEAFSEVKKELKERVKT